MRPKRRHVFGNYVVRVANGQRDALMRHFKSENIGCDIYYPTALHQPGMPAASRLPDGRFPGRRRSLRQRAGACRCSRASTADQQARVMQSCVNFLRQRVRLAA